VATAYVALGANLGDRLEQLRRAARALAAAGLGIEATSPVFETDAVAPEPQPAYLNAALRLTTSLPPRALLALLLETERGLGRVRPPGRDKAPRTIDLDLLLHGDRVVDEPGLAVPHPGLLLRPFVRIPLAAVAAAGLCHPISGERLDVAAPDPAVRLYAAEL
jgi:2-amino-4-hydroxy-6-hydroxymethyldihydropteridine diphosphokinase